MPDAPHHMETMDAGWLPPSLPLGLVLRAASVTAGGASSNETDQSFMQTYDTGTFLASLWTNMVLASLWFLLWNGLRRVVKAVYEPRTYIPPRDQQAPPLGTDPKEILNKNGVDPYIFVRFLRLLMKAVIPIWLVSWVVLFPINSVGGASRTGLDMFAMSNSPKLKRYWAHLCLAYLFNGWIMTLLWLEMKVWLKTRQEWLVSPKHSCTAQASTVLITGIPEELMDEDALTKLYSYLPGGVYRVWLQRDLRDMPKVWQKRISACHALEDAQTALIRTANKIDDKVRNLEAHNKPVPESLRAPSKEGENGTATAEIVPDASRPKIRLKPSWAPFSLGWLGVGEKVDAITYYRKEVEECTITLTKQRKQLEHDILTPGNAQDFYKPLSAAFICFNQQIAAHIAKVFLPYGEPYHMAHRYIELSPDNVIWGNMGIKSDYELHLRTAVSFLITAGLVIAFIFPVVLATFVLPRAANTSIIGNVWGVGSIAVKGEGFGSKLLLGLLTGLVPPILLMLILMIAPTLLRQLAKLHNFTKTEIELDVMDRYFAFLLIERFLIPTIATLLPEGNTTQVQWWPDFSQGASKALQKAFEIQLPQASTFFITLLLLQVTGQFVQLFSPITLIIYYSKVILGSGTPRSFYNARYKMNSPAWGSEWPNMTVYFVILIVYMVIAPVINGFGAILAVVAYHVYKYLYLWVLEQKPTLDTGGEFFPRAITHVFVGIYIGEVALTIIFFGKGIDTLPLAILMIILIVASVAVQYMLVTAYKPLLNPLPLSLAHLTHGQPSADAKSDDDQDDKVPDLSNGTTGVDDEDAMWYRDPVSPVSKGVSKRQSVISMRSWQLPQNSPRVRAHGRPSATSSPAVPPLVRPSATSSPAVPPLVLPSPKPVATKPEDVEMSDLRATRRATVTSWTAVPPSPTSAVPPSPTSAVPPSPTSAVPHTPTSAIGPSPLSAVTPSPTSDDAQTDEVTEDLHSETPINRPRLVSGGRSRSMSLAPWEDHRHKRSNSAPQWELRRSSTSRSIEANQEDIRRYFARPGGPGVIRPPDDSASPAAFFHPATHQPQPIIWLPQDDLGVAPEQVRENRKEGVKSTTRNAVLDAKNRVLVVGPAPDDK
ncbi:uncharacterized protein CcaverHIS019_0307120 [Cutaneotrichosporon cavernicola]|uniref:DUF221-domain-containing protein n=1 Tax=Cutaneotrichosporon cavernicola TaxID=279322 RepID=A0AA48I7C9_9TREE|nr:uncharacterized protein CcaverHIS019_0307120 [Cutaneotrichosporon cavernicola]BEI90642.1 hypothetical protein CcaverHIS019_0307120 [Cutaneotrichosporon cavernicola]BEI98420.1 hypothetical protein CcaverHIS631_0307190 [Cutaneotrichosporon cavernicola]BEJ06193.1 hypothetical protein CcaverHIS641_0307150 [Cutaneotrichosporon cavernicola]